jgi:uncharacterized protein YndB with AHSA1/START domain
MTTTERTRRDFTLTWTLDAPAADVFQAWTDPDHLDWYYNPNHPPTEPLELELRVGGVWRQHMVIDEETDFMTGGVYREIVPNEKLVFAWGATDGWPRIDLDALDEGPQVTVTLHEGDGRTVMTVHVELPASLSEDEVQEWFSMGVRDGWQDTVDRLASALADASATG